MMHSRLSVKVYQVIMTLLLVFSLGACALALPGFASGSAAPAESVTQEETRMVTLDVTREVTQLVQVPVTLSPTDMPVNTLLPPATPAIPPISGPPVVTIREYSDCLYGPAALFLYKTSLPAASQMEVVGRNPDGSWIDVQEVHGWDPCWIPAAQASFENGNLEAVPVAYPSLPISYWYKPPNPTAHRNGNDVTVSWQAVGMAESDYRGYLIIAWVCQGGLQVFQPIFIIPAYAENTGTLSTTIKDEPGCSEVSNAQIYTAEKRGYFGEKIFWPPF